MSLGQILNFARFSARKKSPPFPSSYYFKLEPSLLIFNRYIFHIFFSRKIIPFSTLKTRSLWFFPLPLDIVVIDAIRNPSVYSLEIEDAKSSIILLIVVMNSVSELQSTAELFTGSSSFFSVRGVAAASIKFASINNKLTTSNTISAIGKIAIIKFSYKKIELIFFTIYSRYYLLRIKNVGKERTKYAI